jgi:hypothetical protein
MTVAESDGSEPTTKDPDIVLRLRVSRVSSTPIPSHGFRVIAFRANPILVEHTEIVRRHRMPVHGTALIWYRRADNRSTDASRQLPWYGTAEPIAE